jgi:hypothetical protein
MKPQELKNSDFSRYEAEKFWSCVDRKDDGQCWPWLRFLNRGGYGNLRTSMGTQYAHRVAFALTRGLAPSLTLDHTCRNKRCCNPAHLEPVTQSENIIRWWATQDRVNCACGAPRRIMSGRNRKCRDCHNAYYREYNRKRKALAIAS